MIFFNMTYIGNRHFTVRSSVKDYAHFIDMGLFTMYPKYFLKREVFLLKVPYTLPSLAMYPRGDFP